MLLVMVLWRLLVCVVIRGLARFGRWLYLWYLCMRVFGVVLLVTDFSDRRFRRMLTCVRLMGLRSASCWRAARRMVSGLFRVLLILVLVMLRAGG